MYIHHFYVLVYMTVQLIRKLIWIYRRCVYPTNTNEHRMVLYYSLVAKKRPRRQFEFQVAISNLLLTYCYNSERACTFVWLRWNIVSKYLVDWDVNFAWQLLFIMVFFIAWLNENSHLIENSQMKLNWIESSARHDNDRQSVIFFTQRVLT